MNIDESVFRMPIYSVQTNYIVMNIDESMFCIPIYSVQGHQSACDVVVLKLRKNIRLP